MKLRESRHEYSKMPGKVVRGDGNPFIIRKRKSGERLHTPGSREEYKGHFPNRGEFGGQLARKAKGASSELKKYMVQTGSETDPYSLGKGSKSARRVAALKAKRGITEGVRRLHRLAKSKKLGLDSFHKDFSSAHKKVVRRNHRAIKKYGKENLANMRVKGHEISRNTKEVNEGVRRVDRLALSTRAPMSAFRKAVAKLSRRNAKYFEKIKKQAGPGINLKAKSFPKKRVEEAYEKLYYFLTEMKKYEDYLEKKSPYYLTRYDKEQLRKKMNTFHDPYSEEGAGLRRLGRRIAADNFRKMGGVKHNKKYLFGRVK